MHEDFNTPRPRSYDQDEITKRSPTAHDAMGGGEID
jgi:hypothetical protein